MSWAVVVLVLGVGTILAVWTYGLVRLKSHAVRHDALLSTCDILREDIQSYKNRIVDLESFFIEAITLHKGALEKHTADNNAAQENLVGTIGLLVDTHRAKQEEALETFQKRLDRNLDDSNEYSRAVLSAFINSATDIITISEEEKKHLRNKLSAAKLNK